MKAIWAKNLSESKNITLAFVLDLQDKEHFEMDLAAASLYRVYLDGEFIAFGPQRAAKGYARNAHFNLCGKHLVVEVENIYVETFWVIKQLPFFACKVKTDKGIEYSATDFECRLLTDRIQKVQKYSYQRGFAESYKMKEDRRGLYLGEKYDAPILETTEAVLPILLDSLVDGAKYNLHLPQKEIETGYVHIDEGAPVWRIRAHEQVGTVVDGYKIEEWEDRLTDEVSKFCYSQERQDARYTYRKLDFSRAITGFLELKVKTNKPTVVYVIYDELLWHEKGLGENHIAFERNQTANVYKCQFERAREYCVTTFEPYTCRYACIVCEEGVEVQLSIRDYENPNTGRLQFVCADKRVEKIVEAARATIAQNSVDLLTDCPSRERAGWLSDAWFSSVAEKAFTGENQAERAFLDNYAKSHRDAFPKGMIPMCYPSDSLEGTYIPNWAFWYILELSKYAKTWGKDDIIKDAQETVYGILSFFEKYENELGLLENLESWVFIEWSDANEWEHIRGVNIPSNITYAACLEAASELYGEDSFKSKSREIRQIIKQIAFDGKFFVDNLIRDEHGALKQTGLLTEVCQYYAFWFNCITPAEYPELYEELMERLGTNRKKDYSPNVGTSNVMYGLYMRIDLLMRAGKREQVLQECIRLFEKMADRTGTLWEHNGIYASCNHGFASYAIKWIIYALSGYDCINCDYTSNTGIGIDCEIKIPSVAQGEEIATITVKNNLVTIT
jgi:alpha-L-rhamnosidase